MKKKLFFAAIALTTLAGCTSDDFVGDQSLLENENGAISFNMKTPAITRADKTGNDAATLLNNQFVVFGYKTMSSGTSPQTVFSNYQANYVDGSNNKTTTNSAGWEYVGYKFLASNMTGHTGVAGNIVSTTANDQTIKYWDYEATSYKFYAYSLGVGKTGSPNTYANASLMSTSDTYTLEGDHEQLASCYISELLTIDNPNSSTSTEVDLRFMSFLSKIRIGFFETIPGYSVKDVKFYVNNTTLSDYDTSTDGNDGLAVTLYDADGTASIPDGGTYTIGFNDNGKPILSFSTTNASYVSSHSLGTLNGFANKEYQETAGNYIGRAANEATYAYTSYTDATTNEPYTKVLPNPDGIVLTLKISYTLVSRDGTNESIDVERVTATIPAKYTQWKPNFAYTYLFKLTDDKLTPITLDAVVIDDAQGNQETITTVSTPSITTFGYNTSTKEYTTGSNEYPKNMDIYATIMSSTGSVVTPVVYNATGWNVKVYSVDYKTGATAAEKAGTPITEASVENAIAHTGGLITATDISEDESTYFTAKPAKVETVPAEDGKTTKTINALKLSGIKSAGYYAIEYTYTESSTTKHAYKVIKVVN